MKIEIEKNVPTPNSEGGKTKYPFAQMEVNDSFFVPNGNANSINSAAGVFRKTKQPTWKFTVRKVKENDIKGVRVWRTQ
jgi:hypothetical protein